MAAVLAALMLVGAAVVAVAAAVVVALVVVMVAAADVGALGQDAGDQLHDGHVSAAVDAGVQVDAGRCQGVDGAAADAAADQGVHLKGAQEGGQGAVAAAVGVHHHGPGDLAVLHIVELELLGVAEVLENAAVFVEGCEAIRVTTCEEVEPAIRKAISLNAPVLIECVIPKDDKVFPMVPAGAAISEVFDGDDLARKNAK